MKQIEIIKELLNKANKNGSFSIEEAVVAFQSITGIESQLKDLNSIDKNQQELIDEKSKNIKELKNEIKELKTHIDDVLNSNENLEQQIKELKIKK